MGPVIVGVVGTLLGILVGNGLQQMQASRNRRWQQQDSLNTAKQKAYSEFVRSISASYGQAVSRQRNRSEDGRLDAATAEIEILAGKDVSGEARKLMNSVIKAHSKIAEGASEEEAGVDEVDRHRYAVIELFKADLRVKPHP